MIPEALFRHARRLLPTALFAFLAMSVHADEIVLTNGDRLTGTVISKTPEGLKFKTPYAGVLRIDWRMVETLTTDEPVDVMLRSNEGRLDTRLQRSEEARTVRLAEAPEVPPLKLDRISYLNPTPSQSGEGFEYKWRANVAGNSVSGNSETTQLAVETEMNAVGKTSRYSLRIKAEERTDHGVESASNYLASADRDWFVTKKNFIYARTTVERDPYRDLSTRASAGSGYGLQLIDNDQTGLSVKGGLELVRENRVETDDQNYPAIGWGVNYRHWLIGRSAEFFHQQDGYMNARDSRDVTLKMRTGFRLPIVERLSAQVQGVLDWEGLPAEGRKSADMSLQFGVGYEW
ncbi:DUF481 domain-containing protein [Azoarcus sp. L1K30]|uniref:DUF481 domain-containing protein n=1 Tax=Azoarcus sp. L1K30 TaxID=2820277 RepID=UPI001B80EE16|nr:DUF481 domain-containing protein [Azoarcus sp. L1K30]MBR0564950.1 DUF481 domain-containing protein [Azoarcus sp. L1K30]